MSTEQQKAQLLTSLREVLSELARVDTRGAAIVEAFVARAYDAAAADPVTQAQLDPFGVVPYDLGAAINLFQALTALLNDPTHAATIAKWRQV